MYQVDMESGRVSALVPLPTVSAHLEQFLFGTLGGYGYRASVTKASLVDM